MIRSTFLVAAVMTPWAAAQATAASAHVVMPGVELLLLLVPGYVGLLAFRFAASRMLAGKRVEAPLDVGVAAVHALMLA